MLIQRLFPGKSSAWRTLTAQSLYCLGVAFLLILSEIFSSNIQATLPLFSHFCRLAFTGGATLLLLLKVFAFTEYPNLFQWLVVWITLGYAAFASIYGNDIWFFLAVLVGIGAKDTDLRKDLRIYLITATVCLVLVQLLHFTGLVPFKWYCRNWDYGYGHYNGYGARLTGVFFAWAWLRWKRMRWFDWLGLTALTAYTLFVPVCRGAAGAMMILLAFFVLQKLLPRLFESKVWKGAVLSLYPLCTVFCIWMGYLYPSLWEQYDSLYMKANRLLSGRFEVWDRVFWHTPITLFGGFATDGDEHHSIDTIFLAIPMNKGVIGAVVVGIVITVLLWRLCRAGAVCETMCVTAMLCYGMMENKIFLVSANPLLMLLPCAILWQKGVPLPVLHQANNPQTE